MLTFPCAACGATLQLLAADAGKTARCPACQALTTAPAAPGAIAAGPPAPSLSTAITTPENVPQSGPVNTAPTPAGKGGAWLLALLVCGLGLTCLAALIVPACQTVREAATHTQARNHATMIVLGVHNFHDVNRQLPPPRVGPSVGQRRVDLSWRILLLPYLEQAPLYARFDLGSDFDSPRNAPLLTEMPEIYTSPLRDPTPTQTPFQLPTGPNTVWPRDQRRHLADITDGTANTILFAEAAQPVPWSKAKDMAITPDDPLPLPDGRFLAAMYDGSVRFIDRRNVSDASLRLAIDPSDGRPPPDLD